MSGVYVENTRQMTDTKTTLTDKRQIEEAINHVLGQEMYLPLSKEDFDITCPNPALAVTLLETELARISVRQVSGIIVVLQCISMTMGDLELIDAVFPHTKQIKRGISFTKPEDGEIKIWFFASTCKK